MYGHTYYMYGHSLIRFISGYLVQNFQDLYIRMMVEYLKDNLFIVPLNTQYMYSHAFTYLLFCLHVLELISLKLAFFQSYSLYIMSLNIAQPFFSLMNIST